MKIPVGDHPAVPESWGRATEDVPGRLLAMWRRAGFGVHARVMVPAADARELLVSFRMVTLSIAWALSVTITFLVAVSIGMSSTAIIVIVALELVGFTVAALTACRRRLSR